MRRYALMLEIKIGHANGETLNPIAERIPEGLAACKSDSAGGRYIGSVSNSLIKIKVFLRTNSATRQFGNELGDPNSANQKI